MTIATSNMPSMTGPVQDLTGHVEPRNDEVIAVFRNGAVIDIAGPGRRVRPIHYRPRPGALTYVRILRSDIRITTVAPRVLLSDGFTLPSVEVQTMVALNPARGYAGLRARLEDRGLSFAEALIGELAADMDAFVRRLFVDRTSDEVAADPSPASLGTKEVLLKELFVVDSVRVTPPANDPRYDAVIEEVLGRAVDAERNARVEANATARGLTMVEYENPDLVRLTAQQTHELNMEALRQRIESERLDVERGKIAADLQATTLRVQGEVSAEALRNIGALGRAKASGVLQDLNLLGAAPGIGGSSGNTGDAGEPVPAPVDELARDSALLRLWKRADGSAGVLRGAVHVQEEDGELVLVVVDARWWNAENDRDVVLARAFGSTPTVAIAAVPALSEWVATLAGQRTPRLTTMQPTWAVEEQRADLRVLVGSGTGQARQALLEVTRPETLVVPALSALLPYEEISFGLAPA